MIISNLKKRKQKQNADANIFRHLCLRKTSAVFLLLLLLLWNPTVWMEEIKDFHHHHHHQNNYNNNNSIGIIMPPNYDGEEEEESRSTTFSELKHLCLELLDLLQNRKKNTSTLAQLHHFLRRSSPDSLQPFFEYVNNRLTFTFFSFVLFIWFTSLL